MNTKLSLRQTGILAGVFYLLTFVSIPTLSLFKAMHEPGFMLGNDRDSPAIIGSILEVIVALSGIATAVILYPVLKKQNKVAALGLVAVRILEAGTIFLGVVFIQAVTSLHQHGAGIESMTIGQTLVTLYDRTFIIGQSLLPAFNDLLLGYLFFKSRLIPRWLSVIGMIGAFPLIGADLALQFGLIGREDAIGGIAAIPVAFFEFSVGVYLTFWGFKPSNITQKKSWSSEFPNIALL